MIQTHALVTGGAGFIGSHLVEDLISNNIAVTVLDNLSSGFKKNIHQYLDAITFIEGDIRDPETLSLACKHVDHIYHLAAIGSVPFSLKDPQTTFAVNGQGTLNVFEQARKQGIKKIVYASSTAIYGNCNRLPIKETELPQPLSPYAATKLSNEAYASAYSTCYDMDCIGLRFFNVYGPQQAPDSQYAAVIPKFYQALLQNKQPVIYGDGTQSRDFVFVKDVVKAMQQAAEHSHRARGNVFNIANGTSISILKLLETIAKQLNTPATFTGEPMRSGEVKHSHADIQKANQLLSWQPQFTLDSGLSTTGTYYQSIY